MTIRELSIELGVASAYMEDEVALLEKYKLLTPLTGGKYQTDLVIFTSDYTREFYKSAKEFCTVKIGTILKEVREALPKLRDIGFRGSSLDDNSLMWPLLWFIMHRGSTCFQNLSADNQPDEIYDGATGINYGMAFDATDFDTPDDKMNIAEYECSAFAGYSSIDDLYSAMFADFGVLPIECHYTHYYTDFMRASLRSGSDEYAVFTVRELARLTVMLQPQIIEIASLYNELSICGRKLMSVHTPETIGKLVDRIIIKTLLFRTVGLIGKCAVDSGELIIPDDKKPVAVLVYETTEQDKATVNEGVQA